MKTILLTMVLMAFGGILTGMAGEVAPPAAAAATMQPRACPACQVCTMCKTMSMEAGKCPKCGMDMTPMHLLKVKDGMAYCCGCGASCDCKPMEGAEMKTCGCGKAVTAIPLKGKYVCGAGMCNMVSDTPGKCACGKELKEVK